MDQVGNTSEFSASDTLKSASGGFRATQSLPADCDMKMLRSISEEMIASSRCQPLFEKIVDGVMVIVEAQHASLQMLFPDRGAAGELRLLAYRGFDADAAKSWEWVRADSHCTCGEALRLGVRAITPDVEECDYIADSPHLAIYRQNRIRAVQSTPLVTQGGQIIGMFSTHWDQPHAPSDHELAVLDVLARQVADAIERTVMEEAVRYQSKQLKTLIDQAPWGIYLLDANLQIRHVNPAAWPVFNTISGGVIGRNFEDIIPRLVEKSQAEQIIKIFHHTLKSGQPYYAPEHAEYRVDRPATEYYEWRLDRITLPDGSFGLVCYFRDISTYVHTKHELERNRRHLEELVDQRTSELIESYDALHRTEAMAILGSLSAGIAHDLGNLLLPLESQILQLKASNLSDDQRQATDMLSRSVAYVADLANRLRRTVTEVSSDPRQSVPVASESQIVRLAHWHTQAEQFLRHTLPPQLKLMCDVPQQLPALKLNPVGLTQAVHNLIQNAVKAILRSGTGDTIVLRATLSESGGHRRVEIRIEDNGPGMPAEILSHCTRARFTTDAECGSMGLGLSLVKSFVEQAGGEMIISSPPEGRDRGTRVCLRFDAA